MTSRITTLLWSALLATSVVCSGCSSDSSSEKDESSAGTPDRSAFVPITTAGIAAVVDRHLGEKVQGYYVFTYDGAASEQERYVGVRIRGADRLDTFLVNVFPAGKSQGEVVTGPCAGAGEQDQDPMVTVSCSPVAGGGNVTITDFKSGLSGKGTGGFVTASGTGPKEREATATYESAVKEPPVSTEELRALLSDPDLGWETDPSVNKAGESIEVAREQ
jgi:hypothetical protein